MVFWTPLSSLHLPTSQSTKSANGHKERTESPPWLGWSLWQKPTEPWDPGKEIPCGVQEDKTRQWNSDRASPILSLSWWKLLSAAPNLGHVSQGRLTGIWARLNQTSFVPFRQRHVLLQLLWLDFLITVWEEDPALQQHNQPYSCI